MTKQSGVDGIAYLETAKTITGASHSAGTVTVTATSHGLGAGDMILIASVVGMTDLNGHFVIDAVATNTFDVTLTTAQSYSSGGTAQQVIELTNWDKDETDDIIDCTDSSNAGWREKIAKGIKSASGTISGFRYDGNDPAELVGTTITSLKLYSATGNYWSGTAIFGTVSDVVPVESADINRVTYNWEGNGAWAET